LSPEKSWATLPLGQVRRPRLGSHFNLWRWRRATLNSPLLPSTMIARASSIEAATSAIRTGRLHPSR
jgi:hypothetical protein